MSKSEHARISSGQDMHEKPIAEHDMTAQLDLAVVRAKHGVEHKSAMIVVVGVRQASGPNGR